MTVLALGLVALALIAQTVVFVVLWRINAMQQAEERHLWQTERQLLLDRIQAPEMVARPMYTPKGDEPRFVAPDDDEAWSELAQERSSQ